MAGRIFITGDTHGPVEIRRLGLKCFPPDMDKEDFVIVCGDFGLVWADDSKTNYWLRWLEKKPFTTLFVDGNHENFDMLDAMRAEEWNGGLVHRVSPSVIHLMRGQVFDICGRRFFCMGGARSVDKERRTPHKSWWPQEMPSAEERAAAYEALERSRWRVDYVLTHCAASNVQYRVNPAYENDELTRFLFEVERRLAYRRWFFGHYHEDRDIGTNQTLVYGDVIEIAVSADGAQDEVRRVFSSLDSPNGIRAGRWRKDFSGE